MTAKDTHGKMVSPTFLHAGTLAMFEAAGFEIDRHVRFIGTDLAVANDAVTRELKPCKAIT